MSTSQFRLDAIFADNDLRHWYNAAAIGDVALVEIPSHACVVELRRRAHGHILWNVLGGRSLTMPLAEAVRRFQMLNARRLSHRHAHTPA
jgi:hypothetical protein